MASSLTYSDFASQFPDLATDKTARQELILQLINDAEQSVARSVFGESIPAGSNISRADRAVLLVAAHRLELRDRHDDRGFSFPGAVTSKAVGAQVNISVRPASSSPWSATVYGEEYRQMLSSRVKCRLPLVLG